MCQATPSPPSRWHYGATSSHRPARGWRGACSSRVGAALRVQASRLWDRRLLLPPPPLALVTGVQAAARRARKGRAGASGAPAHACAGSAAEAWGWLVGLAVVAWAGECSQRGKLHEMASRSFHRDRLLPLPPPPRPKPGYLPLRTCAPAQLGGSTPNQYGYVRSRWRCLALRFSSWRAHWCRTHRQSCLLVVNATCPRHSRARVGFLGLLRLLLQLLALDHPQLLGQLLGQVLGQLVGFAAAEQAHGLAKGLGQRGRVAELARRLRAGARQPRRRVPGRQCSVYVLSPPTSHRAPRRRRARGRRACGS